MHCTLVLLLASCLALTAAQQQSGRSAVTSALVRSLKHLSEKEVRPNADIGGPTVWVNLHLFGLEKLVCSTLCWQKKYSLWRPFIHSNVSNDFCKTFQLLFHAQQINDEECPISQKDRTNVLQAGLSVDLRWNDVRLSWDPAEFGNISNIFFPIKHMWVPDITIWQR